MLPFVKPPAARTTRRIGNDLCGIIEMQVRGGLTVTESSIINELLDNEPSTYAKSAALAEAIGAQEEISITEAFQIIQDKLSNKTLEPEALAITLRHAARIEEILSIVQHASHRASVAAVTALIRTRCARPTWTMEQTTELEGPLFDGIYALSLEERDAENMPSDPPTEDDLKKQPPEETPARKPTGKRSSGS